MRTNPFSDVLGFLTQDEWTSYVFWVLIVSSIVIAAVNLFRNSEQRSLFHLWNWLARFVLGAMWWQQSVWKAPNALQTDLLDGITWILSSGQQNSR